MERIISPVTGRSIVVGGSTYNKLIDEGVLSSLNLSEDLPKDMIDEIFLQTHINSIGALCETNKKFKKRCGDVNFWKNYINHTEPGQLPEPQDRFHRLLVELAKAGEWLLYDFIWRSDLGLLKERRTIVESYKQAYMAGRIQTAKKIESAYPIVFENSDHNNNKILYNLYISARQGDRKGYLSFYKELIISTRDLRGYSYETYLLLGSSLEYAIDYDFLKFIVEVIDDDDIVIQHLLKAGKFEWVERLIDDKHINDEGFYLWGLALQSSRNDAREYVKRKDKDIAIDPDYISGSQTWLGNPQILIKYAYKYPNDHETILKSATTLPANKFIELYTKTAKCITNDDLSMINNRWRREGLDYLLSYFIENIPQCD